MKSSVFSFCKQATIFSASNEITGRTSIRILLWHTLPFSCQKKLFEKALIGFCGLQSI